MRRYHQHQFYYTHTVYYTVHYYCVVVIYLPYVVKDIAEKEKKVLGSNLNPLYLSLYSGKRGIATTVPLDTNTYQLHIFNKYKYYMVDRCGTYTYHHPYVGCVCTYTYSAIDTRSKTIEIFFSKSKNSPTTNHATTETNTYISSYHVYKNAKKNLSCPL